MTQENLLSRQDLADRWRVSLRTVDRLRQDGRIPWIDVAGGKGARAIVRFEVGDILAYERRVRKDTSQDDE